MYRCLWYLLCICLYYESRADGEETKTHSNGIVDLTISGVSITIVSEPKITQPEIDRLTDGNDSSCLTARTGNSNRHEMAININFRQCHRIKTVKIDVKKATLSKSSYFRVFERSLCENKTGTTQCQRQVINEGSTVYNCSQVSSQVVSLGVPVGVQICDVQMYTRVFSPLVFVRVPSRSKAVQLSAQTQNYQIGETARVLVNHALKLHCNATGYPLPLYRWHILTADGTSPVSNSGTESADSETLTITRVQRSDENVYQCTASNSIATITKSSMVKVYGAVDELCKEPTKTNTSSSSLAFSFSCPSGNTSDPHDCHIVKYTILFRREKSGKRFEKSSTRSTSFQLVKLVPFTSYAIRVKAIYDHSYCNSGSASSSPSAFIKTDPVAPTAPTNVKVVNRTATEVFITWHKPVYVNGTIDNYRVDYRNNTQYSKLSTSASVTLTSLRPYTSYTFTVRARALNLVSKKSLEKSFTTRQASKYDVAISVSLVYLNCYKSCKSLYLSNDRRCILLFAAPSQPLKVQVLNTTSTSVRLWWLPPLHLNGVIAKYNIMLAEGRSLTSKPPSSKSLAVSMIVNGHVRSANVTNLTHLTWYRVWIVAVNVQETTNQQLMSPPSNVTRFSTPPKPSSVPRDVHVNVTGVSATITWEAPLDVPRAFGAYCVLYFNSSSSSKEWKRIGYKDVRNHKSVTLSNLRPYTRYRTTIRGYLGDSLWTSSVSNNFTTKQTAPSPPQNINTERVGARFVTVKWSSPVYENGVVRRYKVFVQFENSSSSTNWQRVNKTLNAQQTQLTLHGLTPVTTYSVWVAAINIDGGELISDLAGPATFTTIEEASSPPRNVLFANVTSTSVVVKWSQPSNIYGTLVNYTVSLIPSLDAKNKQQRQSVKVAGNTFSTTVGNLFTFTYYTIEVRAGTIRIADDSSLLLWSDPNTDEPPLSFTTKQSAPSRPVNLKVANVSSRSVHIKWGRPKNPNGIIQFYKAFLFQVKQDVNGSLNSLQPTSTWKVTQKYRTKNNSTQVEIKALSPYTQYRVTVKAVNVMDGAELVSKNSQRTTFKTNDEDPAAPSSCAIDQRNATMVYVTWQPPLPLDYQVAYYDVTYGSQREAETYSIKVYVYDHRVQVNYLLPFTEYNITVTAFTNNTRLRQGPPCYLKTRTEIGTPPVPRKPQIPVNVTATSNTVTLSLPTLNETNGPIRSVEIIVVELKRGIQWSEALPLPKSGDSRIVKLYVAEELFNDQRDKQFVVGANKGSNLPLKPNTTYAFYVQWIAQEEDSGQQLVSTSPAIVYSTAPVLHASSSSSSTYLIPVIVVFLLLLGISVTILVIWIRRKKMKPKNPFVKTSYYLPSKEIPLKTLSAIQTHDDTDEPPVHAHCLLSLGGNRDVSIAEFEQHVETLKADDNEGFVVEFDELADVGSERSSEFARHRKNAKKNRYQNIVPYDGYCLMLDEVNGMDALETRYINATYLDGPGGSNEYIVTQGPLVNTCADFWRMIWMTKTETIVMLTRTVETGKTKCYQYWLDDEPKLCEGLTVEVALRTEMADYTVRTMKLKLLDEVRTVTHYNFRSWPDHGVPTYATDLLGLIYRVRRDAKGSTASPLVVHCSAGVGRSGAYVTIDSLLRCLGSGQKIDVKSTVRQMRMRRTEMVQSVNQYTLIHDAVLEAYYTSKTEIPVSDVSSRWSILQEECSFSGSKLIDQEFSILIKISPPPDKSAFKTGMHPTVLTRKNRDPSFIPPDSARVTLNVDDDSTDAVYANTKLSADYINASFINGYYKRDFFVVTQAPLPCTVTDMWKMVYEQGASAIVNLAQPDEHEQYWPESGSQSYGNLKIDFLSSENRKTFTVYKLQLTKRQSVFDVSLFHFTSWPKDAAPSDISEVMEMKRQLQQWMADNNGRRMIVHCCTGMGRTGVFCAVYNILDQIEDEGIVNVLHVAKLLRNQRPGIIHSQEHYETIYKMIKCSQQQDAVYANL